MNTFWLGRRWSELQAELDLENRPYQLIIHKPARSRFTLDYCYRIVAIKETIMQLVITVVSEQEPLI